MSADHELLELAAKAAGIKVLQRGAGYWMIQSSDRGMKGWNPLLSDGDVLRLAVKLRIHVEFTSRASKPTDRVQASPRGNGHMAHIEMFGVDELAAVRRAIVIAAAEIGKAMP